MHVVDTVETLQNNGTSPPKKPNALNSNANKASKIQRGHCGGLIVFVINDNTN